MTEQISLWRAEHANFSMLLSMLEGELAAFEGGAVPDHGLIGDVVLYLLRCAGRAHHPSEELAFDRMVAREPSLALPLGRLRQEHQVLMASGTELFELLDRFESGTVASRGPIADTAATFLVYYRHHLMVEDREFLPRAAQLLTPEDWAAVQAVAGLESDPLFGDLPEPRFADLRRRIDREAGES